MGVYRWGWALINMYVYLQHNYIIVSCKPLISCLYSVIIKKRSKSKLLTIFQLHPAIFHIICCDTLQYSWLISITVSLSFSVVYCAFIHVVCRLILVSQILRLLPILLLVLSPIINQYPIRTVESLPLWHVAWGACKHSVLFCDSVSPRVLVQSPGMCSYTHTGLPQTPAHQNKQWRWMAAQGEEKFNTLLALFCPTMHIQQQLRRRGYTAHPRKYSFLQCFFQSNTWSKCDMLVISSGPVKQPKICSSTAQHKKKNLNRKHAL